jgi:Flp pilus assembly protein TadG
LMERSGERGQSLLELALAMPILTLILLGTIQLGLWYHAESVVLAACQDGARVASAEGSSVEEGLARSRALVQSGLGRIGEGVEIAGAADDERVVFIARGRLRSLVPGIGGGTLPLAGEAAAFRERFRPGGDVP